MGDISDPVLLSQQAREGEEGGGGGEGGEGTHHDQLVLGSGQGHVDPPPVTE